MNDGFLRTLESVRMFVNLSFLIILVFSMAEYRVKKGGAAVIIAAVSVMSMAANIIYIFFHGIDGFDKVLVFTTTIPFLIMLMCITKDGFSKTMYNFWFQADVFCIIWVIVSIFYCFFNISIVHDIFIRIIVYLLILALMLKYVKKPYRFFVENVKANWIAIGLLPMMLAIVFFQNRTIHSADGQTERQLIQSILVVLLMLLTHYVVIKTYRVIYKSMIDSRIEQNMKIQIINQKEQYSMVLQKIEDDKIFRHDIRHHVQAILSLLDEGNIERTKQYLTDFKETTKSHNVNNYTENLIVNTVLTHYISEAQGRGLTVWCQAVCPTEITMDEVEFCVILSNVLENSVQNANTYISISVLQNGDQICTNIENDYLGERKKDVIGDYLSTTDGGSGLGLKSVNAIVKKHGGVMWVDDSKMKFSVHIAIDN